MPPIKKRGTAFFDAEKFARTLTELVGTLPAEMQRQQVVRDLDVLIEFLANLKVRFQSIPTQQDTAALKSALDNLLVSFDQAKTNSIIGTALGVKTSPPRIPPAVVTSEEIDRARSTIDRFEKLAIDEIRSALYGMTARDLQAVANALSVRTSQRTARDALIHQIATKTTNTRGYRSLRDGSGES